MSVVTAIGAFLLNGLGASQTIVFVVSAVALAALAMDRRQARARRRWVGVLEATG